MADEQAGGNAGTPLTAELQRSYALVADLLEQRIDTVAAELAQSYVRELPGLGELADVLRDQTADTLRSVIVVLRAGGAPQQEAEDELRRRAWVWATAGAPLEMVAQTFHVGARRFVSILRENAEALGLDVPLMMAAQDLAWEWGLVSARIVAEVQQEHAVATARRDASRQADFLRGLVAGTIGPERLEVESALFHLDRRQPYHAVVAREDDPARLSLLEAEVRRLGATASHPVLQATADGQLLALVPRKPALEPSFTAAVGPAALLRELHASFAEAELVLGSAKAFGLTGTVDLESAGPLVLATVAGASAARLADVHFTALGGRIGEVEATVRTLIDLDQNVNETALRMHLHRNTVRYRLDRFRELTGLDIRRSRDLVTAWWLLKWRETQLEPEAPAA